MVEILGLQVMDLIQNHIGEVIIAIIAFLIHRSLKSVDKSIEKLDTTTSSLNDTTTELKLEVKDRPSFTETEEITGKIVKAAINEHIIKDHK